ncbi:hypothetical protein evm_000598 [Chilo suppressalis]|nr:hypothetical protein evm_000598 [Chilo suppressalis]
MCTANDWNYLPASVVPSAFNPTPFKTTVNRARPLLGQGWANYGPRTVFGPRALESLTSGPRPSNKNQMFSPKTKIFHTFDKDHTIAEDDNRQRVRGQSNRVPRPQPHSRHAFWGPMSIECESGDQKR